MKQNDPKPYIMNSDHQNKHHQTNEDYNRDGPNYAMYFFLTDERDRLRDLLQQLSSDSALINLRFELKEVLIGTLVIPKFKFKYGFEVTEIMEKMRVVIDVKDSEMLEEEDVSDNMKTFHSCCIEVNEHGTEATAAATSIRGGGDPPPGKFVADRPFVFTIRDDSSKTPVFLGTVVNPLLNR